MINGLGFSFFTFGAFKRCDESCLYVYFTVLERREASRLYVYLWGN